MVPTGTVTAALRVPFARRRSGWANGFQSLKSPTTETAPLGSSAGRAKVMRTVPFRPGLVVLITVVSSGGSVGAGQADSPLFCTRGPELPGNGHGVSEPTACRHRRHARAGKGCHDRGAADRASVTASSSAETPAASASPAGEFSRIELA